MSVARALALSLWTCLASAACEDVVLCEDPDEGRVLVVSEGRVMYAGQAILVAACAQPCHAEGADVAGSASAPDLDLAPLDAQGSERVQMEGDGGGTVTFTRAALDPAALGHLRSRQRYVFEHSKKILRHLSERHVSADGALAALWRMTPGVELKYRRDGSCPALEDDDAVAMPALDTPAGRELLRQWFACGVPLVEANGPELTRSVAGTIGDQWPACR